jgi:hypothetical protein
MKTSRFGSPDGLQGTSRTNEKNIRKKQANAKPPKLRTHTNLTQGEKELMRTRVLVARLISNCQRLSRKVNENFGGRIFLPGKSPISPENIRRFHTCCSQHRDILNLLSRALELWRMCYVGDHPYDMTIYKEVLRTGGSTQLTVDTIQPSEKPSRYAKAPRGGTFAKRTH